MYIIYMVHSDASLNTNKMETKVWNAAFNSHAFLHLHDSLSGKISGPACTGYIKGSFKRVDETILSQSKLPLLLCWQWPTSLSRSSHLRTQGNEPGEQSLPLSTILISLVKTGREFVFANNLHPFPQCPFPGWRLGENLCMHLFYSTISHHALCCSGLRADWLRVLAVL